MSKRKIERQRNIDREVPREELFCFRISFGTRFWRLLLFHGASTPQMAVINFMRETREKRRSGKKCEIYLWGEKQQQFWLRSVVGAILAFKNIILEMLLRKTHEILSSQKNFYDWLIQQKCETLKIEKPVLWNPKTEPKMKWTVMDGWESKFFFRRDFDLKFLWLIWKLSNIFKGTKSPKMRGEGQVTFLGALFLAITSKFFWFS